MSLGAVLIYCLFLKSGFLSSDSNGNSTSENGEIHVFSFDYYHVAIPLTLSLWLCFAILAKLVFHHFKKVSNLIPESCLLILLGVGVGAIIHYGNITDEMFFSANLFFLILLPPIVLDAGYFINTTAFFQNFWTIITFAFIGTLINALVVGFILYGSRSIFITQINLVEALLFGSIVSAVDPVAVLAVFEELHVNEVLYIIVFGESILNDAVTVVLYNLFYQMTSFTTVTGVDILKGIALFIVDSIGGTLIGLLLGVFGALVTKFTEHVSVIEPLWVLLTAYLAYLCAELFHFSAILGIFFCGIILKYYTEINVSNQSRTTIKYLIKTLSSSSETFIFMQLGVVVFKISLVWDTWFVILTIISITVVRFFGVFMLTFFANLISKTRKIGFIEQMIMGYGGLRGAVAFSLTLILPESSYKNTFVSTVIYIVLFTCFIQGISMKPLVKLLKVRLSIEKPASMFSEVNETVVQKTVKAINSILGVIEYDFVRRIVASIDERFLRRFILRRKNIDRCHDIILKNREILYREAEDLVEQNPSALLGSRDRVSSIDATKLNQSTIFNLTRDDGAGHDPVIDPNMIEKLKKNQTTLNKPALAKIVGKQKIINTHNKYTLEGIGEGQTIFKEKKFTPRNIGLDSNSDVPEIVIQKPSSSQPASETLHVPRTQSPPIDEQSTQSRFERREQSRPDRIPSVAELFSPQKSSSDALRTSRDK